MLTRPPPSLPVLSAALLPRWPAFELNSEKRRVSIWQYARGEDAPTQEVKTQLENNTFDPAHFDMLHVLNGLKYALRSPATSPKQRVWLLKPGPVCIHARLLKTDRIFDCC